MENLHQQWSLPCQYCEKIRTFKRKGAYTTALRLNNTSCYQCSLKTRNVKPVISQTLERNCPACNNLITYASIYKLKRAESQNSKCRKCFIQSVKIYNDKTEQAKNWYQKNKEQVLVTSKIRQKEINEKRRNGDIETVFRERLSRLQRRAHSKRISLTIGLQDLLDCYNKSVSSNGG